MKNNAGRGASILCAAILLAMNVWIVARLFGTEFAPWMHSIEGAYVGLSRWIQGHWTELAWFPLWYGGIPFENAYPPLLHIVVAAAAQIAGASAARAHHFVTAAVYALGPVAMFWLVRRLWGSNWRALVAAWIFSLVSFSAVLMPSVARDMNEGVWGARRLHALIYYGEGPHVTSLTLLIVALAAVHAALASRMGWRTVVAALAMAAVVLTNWLGAMGLALGVLALVLAQKTFRVGHVTLAALLGYALALPWIPPSNLAAIQRNAQLVGGFPMGPPQYIYLVLWLAAAVACAMLLRRTRLTEGGRFAVLFLFLTAVPPLGREWFGVYPLPQPERYHLEMEVAFAIACGGLAGWCRLEHRRARMAAAALMLVLAAIQAPRWKAQAGALLPPFDVTKTVEWEQARWFAENLAGKRVFATGSTRFWLNAFTDNPQLGGGFDQGRSNPVLAHVLYAVPYTERDGVQTARLLRAFGVHAVTVGGERSRDAYRDWRDPGKFRGVLPELWRNGDDAIYGVPGPESLAHVVRREDLVSTWLFDTAAVERFVKALDAGAGRARSRWNAAYRMTIDAELAKGDLVHVQVNWDPGWRAWAGGKAHAPTRDALGLMVLEPACVGHCSIELVFDGGLQGRLTRAACLLAIAACLALLVLSKPKLNPLR